MSIDSGSTKNTGSGNSKANPNINKEKFVAQLRKNYPKLQNSTLDPLVHENLVSPFVIQLPKKIKTQAEAYIRTAFKLRQNEKYIQTFADEAHRLGIKNPGNHGIMMSYDFHIDASGDLKLIEINTNAAFYLLGCELYDSASLKNPFGDDPRIFVQKSILHELSLVGNSVQNPKVAVIDDQPEQQRLFAEFLCYQELFESWGWNSKILDYKNLNTSSDFDFVYNRYTDFFLGDPSSKALLEIYNQKRICLSPHPFEYLLLADKARIIDWSTEGFLSSFQNSNWSETDTKTLLHHTPKTFLMSADKAAEIWSARKNLFFKPRSAFGAKQSYKGASISQKVFQELLNPKFIAQELVPAPERVFSTPDGHDHLFKFDLRFYAYEDQLQMGIGRIYQGQVTNLKTPHGGFACLQFE